MPTDTSRRDVVIQSARERAMKVILAGKPKQESN